MHSPLDGVAADDERRQHAKEEELFIMQQSSLSRNRKGIKKTTLIQTLLLLSLTLLQQKVQSAQAAGAAAALETTKSSHPTATDNKQRVREKDSSLAMEDSSSTNEIKEAKHWDPVEAIQKGGEFADDSSVLEQYYQPRFLYRDEEETLSSSREDYHVNEDVLVVTSVDGTIAGVSRSTGRTLWRRSRTEQQQENYLNTAERETETHLFDPLVSTTTTTRSSSSDWKTSAVPSIDGKVHLTAPLLDGSDQVAAPEERTDVTVTTTVNELVSRAPFVDNRGRIYTGTRKTLAVAIDSSTGEVLQVVSADSQCSDESSFGEDRQVVWLGRVDQSISIQDPKSGNLDVQFSAGQIMSVNDMVLGSGTRQPWHSNNRLSHLLPQVDEDGYLPPVLLATPSGALACMDPETGRVKWIAEDFFDSPVAFAVDAASGVSLPVNIVPDAAMSNGSTDYLIQEIERQVKLLGDKTATSLDVDEQTIFGTLPSGQLYAMPLGGMLPKALTGRNESPSVSQQQRHQLGSVSYAPHRSWSTQPISKETCRPGSPGFPACLVGSAEWKDPFARPLVDGGHLHGSPPFEDSAIVPFYHPDFGYIPPEHFYTLHQTPGHRKYKKILKILGSWLPPTIALIFVVSFEMGRRKRLKDKQNEPVSNEIITASVQGSASSSNHSTGGVIQVYDDVILGYGGHGTVVYKGLLDGREVAVKRMLKAYHASADREISLLIESDGHPNVVRYFLKEVRGDFVYLALELCDLSLHDLIANLKSNFDQENRPEVRSLLPLSTKTILYQLACGVRHLHQLRIVHRDLKPANILLAKSMKGKGPAESVYEIYEQGQYVAKISDMGLGKQFIGQSSYGASLLNEASLIGQSNGAQPSLAGAGPGSVGWQAPEVMAMRMPSDGSSPSDMMSGDSNPDSSPLETPVNARTSRSVDIFSLGCIFYSTLVPGSHPFGEWYEREANIMHNRPSIDALEELSADAHDLVSAMIQRNPLLRPTAKQICDHPFFWTADRRLTFLCDFSDRLEMGGDESDRATYHLAVERGAVHIVGTSWDCALDDELLSNVQRFRTYDPSSVRDLLRLIRNKYHHFDELPAKLKETMKSKAEGLLEYFERRFPKLLIHCYRVCREKLDKDDPLCTKYSITNSGHVHKFKRVSCQVSMIEEKTDGENEENAQQCSGDMDEPTVEAKADALLDINANADPLKADHLEPSPRKVDASKPEVTSSVELESPLRDDAGGVVIWHGSAAAKTFNCRGWNRSDGEWERRVDSNLRKRDSNLVRCATDSKFRTRLCNHWDASFGTFCPMKKKNKCVFAHGPVELRVKEGKRNRWGKLVDANGDNKNPRHSGGEDTYGAARSIETERKQEGKWNTNKSSASSKAKSKQQTLKRKKSDNVTRQPEVVAS